MYVLCKCRGKCCGVFGSKAVLGVLNRDVMGDMVEDEPLKDFERAAENGY